MSKIERTPSELCQAVRELRDDELDSVSGGFGFVERSFGFILPGGTVLPPNPCRFMIGQQ